ncbi:MAG: flagellar motor switch protein FliN [Microbacteriaceae bacterium]|nr:flagellar motor switch protein FliN [Microbacteriaceae bacterium]HEV7956133.1 flagellar motor switch protein FliN [Marisediminicola sp.]
MTNTTQTIHVDAAEAMVGLLPSPIPLVAVPEPVTGAWSGQTGGAVIASFVGSVSADIGIVFEAAYSVTTSAGIDSALVSVVDVLRPALESAAGVLGTGVLGEARVEEASALFDHDETKVFRLTGKAGATAGWFAIRVRDTAVINSAARPAFDSVGKLGRINSVEMTLTVEIGRTRMSVRDVLSLEPGAVVELDRSAGAPADVLLNGRLIAHGEIVVVDQDYAVRITRILDVAESIA